MSSCISGTLLQVPLLVNQLAAIYIGMRRACEESAKKVIVETDNLEALGVLKFQHNGVPQETWSIIQQILILEKDHAWKFVIKYVYPRRNKAAHLSGSSGCRPIFPPVSLF